MNNTLKIAALLAAFLFFGQKNFSQSTSAKVNIAVVDSYVFEDEQNGITKYVNVKKTVQNEFKSKQDEVVGLQARYEALKKQIESNPSNTAENQKRANEAEEIYRNMKNKSDTYTMQSQKRYQELLQPLQKKIAAAIKDWCAQRGYTAIFDLSKDDKGFVMWVDEAALQTTTADLVRYLNAVL